MMEVAPHQNGQCLECRVDRLESRFEGHGTVLLVLWVAFWMYVAWRAGLFEMRVLHG